MYAARNSGLKKEMFGYVRGGYSRVLERFGEVLVENGVEIRLNSPIDNVEKLSNGKIRVETVASRRRNDMKPTVIPQRTKYGMMRAATAVAAGFSGAFLSEPELVSTKVIDFPVKSVADTFDKVILTCPSNITKTSSGAFARNSRPFTFTLFRRRSLWSFRGFSTCLWRRS